MRRTLAGPARPGQTRAVATTFLLPPEPLTSLDAYLATEIGGLGLARAQEIGPEATIAEVAACGLRGRCCGGFPTGR